MSRSGVQEERLVDWSVAAQPIAGEAVSGDMHLVKPFEHGVLLAAIDGVGHGGDAAAAARVAVSVLEQHATEPVIALVKRCHEALTRTRGVVMSVGSMNARENTVTWLVVGNVEGLLLRADPKASQPIETVLQRSGLVGYQLPALQASVLHVSPGDLIIFATDGIRGDFGSAVNLNETPKRLAAYILQRYCKGNDDALVLVARYLGTQHE